MGNTASQQGSPDHHGIAYRVAQVFQRPLTYFRDEEAAQPVESQAENAAKIAPKKRKMAEQAQSPKRKRSKSLETKDQKVLYVNLQGNGRWYVQYPFEGRGRSLGSYSTKEEALFALELGKPKLEVHRGKSNDEVVKGVRELRKEIREALENKKASDPSFSALVENKAPAGKKTAPGSIKHVYHGKDGKWKIQYPLEGRLLYLGEYESQEDAVCTLQFAKSKLSDIHGKPSDEILSITRRIRKEASVVVGKMSKRAKKSAVKAAIAEQGKEKPGSD